ncbi:hypothetical protein BKM31_14565 [[Actinomadura] parvosata subsp. kistnae]|uniref:Uncharacterized protein n=1 Tax=[Actinomadura] parvosata subsp. kistnae TaxID=1909395 RepID=A0A1U9ZX54_9ACTN|nr:hypothetical protein BKM31_14565 [Nonomuraea sp. ATCC 55076]
MREERIEPPTRDRLRQAEQALTARICGRIPAEAVARMLALIAKTADPGEEEDPAGQDDGAFVDVGAQTEVVGRDRSLVPTRKNDRGASQFAEKDAGFAGLGAVEGGVQVEGPQRVVAGQVDLAEIAVGARQAVMGAGLFGPIADLAGDGQRGVVVGHGLGGIAHGPGCFRQGVE